MRPFEGNCEADVAPGEKEFDTPALEQPQKKKKKKPIKAI